MMIVELFSVTRVGFDISYDKSKSSIRFSYFLFVFILRTILKSPITITSRPVVCAIDSSTSNRSIQSEVELGGR